MGGSEDDRCRPTVSMAAVLPCPEPAETKCAWGWSLINQLVRLIHPRLVLSAAAKLKQQHQSGGQTCFPLPELTSAGDPGGQRRRGSRWRQVEVQHSAVGLVANHHAGNLRPLLVAHQAGGVAGQCRQVGPATGDEAADGTLISAVWYGLQETDGSTLELQHGHMRFDVTVSHLVLHLVLTLIQVLILETPLILHVNMDVKFPALRLSQLTHTH